MSHLVPLDLPQSFGSFDQRMLAILLWQMRAHLEHCRQIPGGYFVQVRRGRDLIDAQGPDLEPTIFTGIQWILQNAYPRGRRSPAWA